MQNNQKVLMLGGGTSNSMLLRLMASSTLVPVDDALSDFAVNDVEAALALSFTTNEYRTGNSETTFADAFTGTSPKLTYSTAAGSNSTMTNSSGELVWAPHNLVPYSEDVSNFTNISNVDGVDVNTEEAPDGTLTADLVQALDGASTNSYVTAVSGIDTTVQHTCRVWAKKATGYNWLRITFQGASSCSGWFDIQNGNKGTETNGTASISDAGNGWWLCSWTATHISGVPIIFGLTDADGATTANNTDGTASMYLWGAHVYRSDLGGMHPVPGAATGFETYVPTNGNPEYLPRVGHHVYNGSAWVNEGLLIESEPRTNLVTNSQLGGAVVGVVGSGGALPTGWSSVAFNTVEVMEIDTFQGVPRIRIKATCDNSGSGGPLYPRIEIGSYGPSASTTYNYSAWVMDGPDRSSIEAGLLAPDGVSNFLNVSCSGATEMTQFSGSATTAAGATGTQIIRVAHTVLAGDIGVSDFYISMPQFEQGEAIPNTNPVQYKDAPTPSSYMPTSGGTYTRTAQSLTVPPAEFGWPEPEYIGPELVDNHDFATNDLTEWDDISAGTGTVDASSGSAVLSYTDPSNRGRIQQNITHNAGAILSITFTVSGSRDAYLSVMSESYVASAGTHTFTVNPTLSNRAIFVQPAASGSGDLTIDNISVREINPLSVSIQMDGRMTYADQNAALNVIWWRWYAGAANDILAYYATDGAYDRSKFTQGSIVEQNTSNDSRYLFSPGINVPFNVAARHGSTFVNGAVDGTALPGDTTPVALPDLSGTNLAIAYDFMGTIGTFRQFAGDIGDTGLVTATNPSTEPTLSLTFDGTGGSFYNLSWSE